jgi:hypothetical protein
MNGCTTVLLRLLLHRSTGHGRPLMRRRRARRLDARRMYLQIYRLVDGSATIRCTCPYELLLAVALHSMICFSNNPATNCSHLIKRAGKLN